MTDNNIIKVPLNKIDTINKYLQPYKIVEIKELRLTIENIKEFHDDFPEVDIINVLIEHIHDTDLIKYLLEESNCINIVNENELYGRLLFPAVIKNQKDTIKYLLKNFTDANIALNNIPLVFCVVEYCDDEILKIILDKNIDVNDVFEDESLLLNAVMKNKYECAELLIKYGAEVDFIHKDHPIIYRILMPFNEKMCKLLIESGADIYKKYNESSIISCLILFNRHNIIQFIIERCKHIDEILDIDSILRYICKNDKINLLDILIKKGFDLHNEEILESLSMYDITESTLKNIIMKLKENNVEIPNDFIRRIKTYHPELSSLIVDS